ncbi:Methylmalonic aciduria and homocystinuria type D -like protein, mitochondrial [Toxocara canis]|uniref:Methylmalonic aciduria and homocystinuria type D-like protein, mitochondrial n=1 Tax=Toxocara canis TaxID=6265 RepID=A0A0B2VF20_TOXCA|nr:Methylmalonic aciduria and homocystinuria type D -like protein, mitochondrial [Toxocara canis]
MRAFSTQVRQEQHVVIYVTNDVDRQNTLLGPSKQFPFPGDVSSKIAFDLAHEEAKISRNLNVPSVSIGEILEESTNKVMRAPSNEDNELATKKVELTAVECPRLLRKDLKELFTGIDLSQRDVCVLNLTQKTDSDMSAWSVEMEIERMQLTSAFIESATAICNALHRFGYWADFIDPSSGRPYLGKFTNATLFETDDRYRSLGFKITDLGCCKILEHALWGTNAFVGTIFTDAPVNSEAVSEILAKVNAD